jgi:superfamily II DNA/RNA helicase
MNPALKAWVSHAAEWDRRTQFGASASEEEVVVERRTVDYLISLFSHFGELLRSDEVPEQSWERLAHAFAFFGLRPGAHTVGVNRSELCIFSSACFYLGAMPASAHLVAGRAAPAELSEDYRFVRDFLYRRPEPRTEALRNLIDRLRAPAPPSFATEVENASTAVDAARPEGPDRFLSATLVARFLRHFAENHLRHFLPSRPAGFWTAYLNQVLSRRPPMWEFFPSQQTALRKGLLTSSETISLQMPTSSGKTALCEVLVYDHVRRDSTGGCAVLIAPFRALASELKSGLVARLRRMSIQAVSVYGGSVTAESEVSSLDETELLVATPEKLLALMGAQPEFAKRISLVICDEGHLLESGFRGVDFELLLTRLKAGAAPPRFVFMSAIIPNIEEINEWLGGTADGVVKTDYRATPIEFGFLHSQGNGAETRGHLEIKADYDENSLLNDVLTRANFRYRSPDTGRLRTHKNTTFKAKSVALARKALRRGSVAVYSPNKRGDQGVLGLAEEFIAQMDLPLDLPRPELTSGMVDAIDFFEREFGSTFTGTRCAKRGGLIHHGDIPQEAREVTEALLRDGEAQIVFCTDTLAEGVNLPLDTIVLYSTFRKLGGRNEEELKVRKLTNIVGRAGRAGASINGLILSTNPRDWPKIEALRRAELEPMSGSFRWLVKNLLQYVTQEGLAVSNEVLASFPELFGLTDAIDQTLIELAAEEVEQGELVSAAEKLAESTYAYPQLRDDEKKFAREVFALRAEFIDAESSTKRAQVRATGVPLRFMNLAVTEVNFDQVDWSKEVVAHDRQWIGNIVDLCRQMPDFEHQIEKLNLVLQGGSFQVDRGFLVDLIQGWVSGLTYPEIAFLLTPNVSIDELLFVLTRVSFNFLLVCDRIIALAHKALEAEGRDLSESIRLWPDNFRHGVPDPTALTFRNRGVRHRRMAVALVEAGLTGSNRQELNVALDYVTANADYLVESFGPLIYQNTLEDLQKSVGA